MRLFISDSQQRSAAAPNRLSANYSENIAHYDVPWLCERASDIITQGAFFLYFSCCFFSFCVVSRTKHASTEVTKQSEVDLHKEGVCFLAIYVEKTESQNLLFGGLYLLCDWCCLSACFQEVMRKPFCCLPFSKRQERQTHKGL